MAMASCCRLILNCVGPYRLYGEPVVRACVECGTDYLDVCGEPGVRRSARCLSVMRERIRWRIVQVDVRCYLIYHRGDSDGSRLE
jgi:hypothetical protein